MKFLHISDLHLGKKVNEFSMIEEQAHILNEFLTILEDEKADAVIIAGDIYDKQIPSAEAVTLFDQFLTELVQRSVSVFLISGNHDSAERISFGSRLFMQNKIYISQVFDGKIEPIVLEDEYGKIFIYLLPFIKPAHVKRYDKDVVIENYQDAAKVVMGKMQIDSRERNILVCHQFVTGAKRSESEEVTVGGIDNIDAGLFEEFDYVALGHIHAPQNILKESIRYCGTLLKYSFSEKDQEKSVTVVEVSEKGKRIITTRPVHPLHDMKEIRGSYEEIASRDFYQDLNVYDYYHMVLTDEEDILDALCKLRTIYPNIMKLSYDNIRTQNCNQISGNTEHTEKMPITYLEELYELQNNQPMSEQQRVISLELMERIWEGGL
ncbi:MAG: exonuclease SbcCD subunit D [Lachnospiraceae bacterium]|nr:exonuclease SbcCD subunit D [Lachnospiraceae bacterium]